MKQTSDMPKTQKISAINIQWPYGGEIAEGRKTVETRTYPIPSRYLNTEMLLIETPGKNKSLKARGIAIIKFTKCFPYKSKQHFYSDQKRHLVVTESKWAWNPEKPKWGWELTVVKLLTKSPPLPKKRGIVFTKEIQL